MRNPSPLATPEALNQSWSVDFMHDALVCGRRFRTFNVVDNFNREALAIEIDLNIPAHDSSSYPGTGQENDLHKVFAEYAEKQWLRMVTLIL